MFVLLKLLNDIYYLQLYDYMLTILLFSPSMFICLMIGISGPYLCKASWHVLLICNQSIIFFLDWVIVDWLHYHRVLWRLGTCPTGIMCKDVDGGYKCLWLVLYFILLFYCIVLYASYFDLNNSNNSIVFDIFMFIGLFVALVLSLHLFSFAFSLVLFLLCLVGSDHDEYLLWLYTCYNHHL